MTEPEEYGAYPPTAMQRFCMALFHDTPLGRTRLRRRAVAAFKASRPGPVDAALFGLRVRFHPHGNQTDAKAAVCGATYNRDELGWLRTWLPPGGVFVDVGANMGFFSLAAAKCGARVVAIEPMPAMFDQLRFNLALNAINAHLVAAAAGDRRGEAGLTLRDNDLGSTSALGCDPSVTVPMLPLVDILRQAGVTNLDLLKIDAEGYEDRVICPLLAHAPDSLWPKAVIMEHSSHADWTGDPLAALQQAGYRVRARNRANLLAVR